MMDLSLSERIIEDILSSDISILSDLISVSPSDLSFIARQKTVKSGKIDLLYLLKNELCLIELKVIPFVDEIINQINNYEQDLLELQNQNKLIRANIRKIIIATSAKQDNCEKCSSYNIKLITYNPQYVLEKFYENFKELSEFLKIQSGDYGVVRLGLLAQSLSALSQGKTIKEISEIEGKSEKTIRNRISVAVLLNLVIKIQRDFYLSDLGNELLSKRSGLIDDRFSEEQVDLISTFVKENPFYSSVTYTIYTIIETIFILSKSNYPVPFKMVQDYFVKSVGKSSTWRTEKARETATYIFSNYACELEFLAKINNQFFITPKGIQAILLLQLNRSLKLIESRK
jgi:hypothetical protein